MILVTDLDGVLADSYSAFRRAAILILGYDPIINQTEYTITIPNVNYDKIHDLYMKVIKQSTIQPYPDWICLDKLNPIEYHIVTARPYETKRATEHWVSKYISNSMNPQIHYIKSSHKCDFIKELNPSLFIEDRARTANHVAFELDIPVYLVSRPWNVLRQLHPKVIRIVSLSEIQP